MESLRRPVEVWPVVGLVVSSGRVHGGTVHERRWLRWVQNGGRAYGGAGPVVVKFVTIEPMAGLVSLGG